MSSLPPAEAARQPFLRFPSAPSSVEGRLFLRSPLLDGTGGDVFLLRDRLAPLGVGERPLVVPSQVHGDRVITAAPEHALPARPEADGILLASPGLEAGLRVADCAPVLVLSNGEDRPWALLLHSGYKGTVLNIVRAGLREAERAGGNAASASAWVGPCISMENYPRRMEEWTERGLRAFHPENVRRAGDRFHFDIAGELRRQLLDCGLEEGRIFLSGMDTVTSPLCYSYRRGDRLDRMFLHVRFTPSR